MTTILTRPKAWLLHDFRHENSIASKY